MKKTLHSFAFICLAYFAQGQVGIGTNDPKATLDVVGNPTNTATPDGVTAPRLTRAQLIAKDAVYTANQTGSIVYVTDLSGTTTAKTIKVTTVGYYFFDGVIWQKISSTTDVDTTDDAWVNNSSASRVELKTLSNGSTVRPAGTQVVATDAGSLGIGTVTPRTKLDINGVVSYNEQNVTVSNTSVTVASLTQSSLSLTGESTGNFTLNLPAGVPGQRLTIINNTADGFTANVGTYYKVQGKQAVDFVYSNNAWRAVGQSINDNIIRMYSGEVIIPPHDATLPNDKYNNDEWRLVSLESGRSTSTTGSFNNSLTSGSQIRSAGKVLVYEYLGKPFDTTKLYPMLTAGNKLTGEFADADTFTPNFVKLENVNNKTRLTVVLARVDYISGSGVGSNANWKGSFFMNVMLIETK